MKYNKLAITDALIRGDLSKLTTMLRDGVDVNSMTVENRTDIVLESIIKKNIFMLERTFEYGFNLNNNNKFHYLHHAIRTKDIDFLNVVLTEYQKQNKNIYELDSKDNNNLLHTALLINEDIITEDLIIKKIVNYKIITKLNELNIDWNWKNDFGQTPLHLLLRKVDYIENVLLVYLLERKELFLIEDNLGISGKDIVLSYKNNSKWISFINNQLLTKELLNE